MSFNFKYGIEYETLLFNKANKCKFNIIESDESQREIIFEYLSKNNVCATIDYYDSNDEFSIKPNWIIDEDVSVDLIDDFKDENVSEDEQKYPSGNPSIDKLYTILFNDTKHISDFSFGKLITCNEIISCPFDFNGPNGSNNPIIKTLYNSLSENPENTLISYHNAKTSTHIHYSFPNNPAITNVNNIFNIYAAWLYFEPVFQALVPPWRKDNNPFCSPIRDMLLHYSTKFNTTTNIFMYSYSDIKNLLQLNDIKNIITAFQFEYSTMDNMPYPYRHKTINMLNLIQSKTKGCPINTIEIRLKHGSCDYEETMKYIELYGLFIVKAVEKGEAFFNMNCASNLPYPVKQILLSDAIDIKIKFLLLKNFIGNESLMDYFQDRLNKMNDPYKKDQNGGNINRMKYTKTNQTFNYKNKNRTIYAGKRGAKYIKIKNKYISIVKLQ